MGLTLRKFVFHVCACMFCLIVYGLISCMDSFCVWMDFVDLT